MEERWTLRDVDHGDAQTDPLHVWLDNSANLTSNVGLLDSADTRIDPATETTLATLATEATVDAVASALASRATDEIRTTVPDTFARIKAQQFADGEEVRYDIPADTANGEIYTGVAVDGTATSTAAWDVVRTVFDGNGNPTREQIREDIAWDNRTTVTW